MGTYVLTIIEKDCEIILENWLGIPPFEYLT